MPGRVQTKPIWPERLVAEAAIVWRGDHGSATWFQNPLHLADKFERIGDVFDHMAKSYSVKLAVRKFRTVQVTMVQVQIVFGLCVFDCPLIEIDAIDLPALGSHPVKKQPVAAPDIEQLARGAI